MNPIAKALIVAGSLLILAGLAWQVGGRFFHLGRLPGDIVIEKENFKFYFPLASSILVSLILSLIFFLFRYFSK